MKEDLCSVPLKTLFDYWEFVAWKIYQGFLLLLLLEKTEYDVFKNKPFVSH